MTKFRKKFEVEVEVQVEGASLGNRERFQFVEASACFVLPSGEMVVAMPRPEHAKGEIVGTLRGWSRGRVCGQVART